MDLPGKAVGIFLLTVFCLLIPGACGSEEPLQQVESENSNESPRVPPPEVEEPPEDDPWSAPVTPFTDVTRQALKNGADPWADQVWNPRPGAVVFDFDRDGDLDLYITQESGNVNFLYRNDGDAHFENVSETAGVAAKESNSSGAVACDVNNDGYQDLYVGARGLTGKDLDFRSALGNDTVARELHTGIQDRLYINNTDGTFREITDSAFGDEKNLRTATTVACADVDSDGWLDIYVGNLITEDYFTFGHPNHPGHFNVLYLNNGDLTFREIAESAGVQGPQILMRNPAGEPMLFDSPETSEKYEGYDPTAKDARGNRIGDPSGRTHGVLFFDYDDDGDADLWVASDGDRLHLFRNDSSQGAVRFTDVSHAMGIDMVGNWMAFAIGDYDGDVDLDIFVTNLGYHPLTGPVQDKIGGDCTYNGRFLWGQCEHLLLRNDGTREVPGLGIVGLFPDVAQSTHVEPSALMPPDSLEPQFIRPPWTVPTGLAAYDFGYGATFFDYDNDGDEDLYWLGSEIDRGKGPGGWVYPGAGRMLRGDGQGTFEDITVRARLLDIADVDYTTLDVSNPEVTDKTWKLRVKLHENGKGVAHGDFNGDGYVDLIGTNSSGPVVDHSYFLEEMRGPIFLWLNGGGQNHWITFRLTGRMAIDGTGSNADAIGARVYLKTSPEGGSKPLVQVQEVRAGSSYLSMDSIDLEFGVGAATVVDEIRILWPSGIEQVLNDIAVDQVLTITEPVQ